jgi:predicted nucleic acid-binding protein
MTDLGRGRTGVDTSIFIYLIEEHPRFLSLVEPIFEEATLGARELVTSALTLLEVLVVPFRASNPKLAGRYEALLTNSKGIAMVDLTRDQLRFAARLRAATGVKTPDALQLAAAFGTGCSTFLTNDRRIPEQRGLRVLQLGDYQV